MTHRPRDPGPAASVRNDLLRMACWNAIFGVVGDAPALAARIRTLVAEGARL